MADDWENEDFEPPPVPAPRRVDDRWEGEDEEEPVKDSWEDEEDEQKPESTEATVKEPKSTSTKNKKKKLEEKIAEKEKKRLEELQKKEVQNGDDDLEEIDMTPEERLAERLRRQKMQEEADLLMASDTFGITPASGVLDLLNPSSKEEFSSAKDALVNKIREWQGRTGFSDFAEEFIRDICTTLDVEALKKVSLMTKAFHEEKSKMAKQAKGKSKGKKTVALKLDKDDNFYNEDYGEYDDFM